MWKTTIEAAIAELAERYNVLLTVFGIALFILGAAAGIRYHGWFEINVPGQQYALEALGLTMLCVGIIFSSRESSPVPDGKKFGVTIKSPLPHTSVSILNVVGQISKKIPHGYSLMLLRIYPDFNNGIYLWAEVRLDADGKNWTVADCDIGGRVGDRRVLGVYLVGPSGKALFQYFREAAEVHNATNANLLKASPGAEIRHLPLIFERTPDMVKCAEVIVTRK
jgi:hypothetical protein